MHSYNTEDGPEFRKTLRLYEIALPLFKTNCEGLFHNLRLLDSQLDHLSTTKNNIIEYTNTLSKLHTFSPLLHDLNFVKDFEAKFQAIFTSFEHNLRFFLNHLYDSRLLSRLNSQLGSITTENNSNGSGNDLVGNKKLFESNSKEFYAWLNKYLSNEKERPALKLLVKRKIFELSKFDYLNFLVTSTNNQYFNQLLENIFKLINLDISPSLGYLELKLKQFSTSPLGKKYEFFLNLVSRYNSEKFLLRQSIEASTSNEELTELLRHNNLSHSDNAGKLIASNDSLDKVFSSTRNPTSSVNSGQMVGITSAPNIHDDQNAEMAGILYTLGGQGKQGWHKEWVVLANGQLKEYSDWRRGKVPINKPIEIALSNVKAITKDKRKHCFEITSLGSKHIFQAINENERDNWIRALYNAGQLVDTERLNANNGNNRSKDSRKKVLLPLLMKLPKPNVVGAGNPDVLSPVSIHTTSPIPLIEKDHLSLVRSLENSQNNICADCGSNDTVEWISVNFLTVFCLKCSSAHRGLGSHISRIKSLKLDNFKDETELLLKYIDNHTANSYLEDLLPIEKKITSNASDEARAEFIQQKYAKKMYCTKIDQDELNDLLIKSIQKIDIPATLKYISCGGDININISLNVNKDEYVSVSLLEYSLRKFIVVNEGSTSKKLFAISELLVLNSCNPENVKVLKKNIGLTSDSIEYWRHRIERLLRNER